MRILCFWLAGLFMASPVFAQKKGATHAPTHTPSPAASFKQTPVSEADKKWNLYADELIQRYFKANPEAALYAGDHRYDSVLVVPSNENRDAYSQFLQTESGSLDAYDTTGLSTASLMDIAILKNEFNQQIFSLNKLTSWQWNPSEHNPCGAFSEILANRKLPSTAKLRALGIRLRNVPLYFKMAQQSLLNPTSVHTQLAVSQIKNGLIVFESELRDSLLNSKLPAAFKNRALADCQRATQAGREFVENLISRPDIGKTDFRLRPDLYERKFDYAIQTGVTAEEAYKAATARKEELHKKMYELALKILKIEGKSEQAGPKEALPLIQKAIDKISLRHCRADSFQEAIRNQIPKLTAFVRYKNLMYLDPSKPLVVRKEPDYMAGVAGASISAPGPFEKGGNTYYNVGSLAGMGDVEKELYLREYNNYTLQILNIHEAVPGHYTQLVYANKSPSLVKSIFGNGAMIEGWAVYTELMMLENGYGGNSPEMWLAYYKWNLRTACNTILDYSIHNKGMTEEEALDLLRREAFQTETEAKGKWKRATLTSVQLCSYFTGFDAIYKLREELKAKQGAAFNLKAFHERFLSYGSAPVSLIAKDMLLKP